MVACTHPSTVGSAVVDRPVTAAQLLIEKIELGVGLDQPLDQQSLSNRRVTANVGDEFSLKMADEPAESTAAVSEFPYRASAQETRIRARIW